jgi:hypothetical protein
VREVSARDRERLGRAWETYQARRKRADERRLEENDRALVQLAAALRKLLDEGYSMTDLGRELGITRQAVHDLLRRAAK